METKKTTYFGNGKSIENTRFLNVALSFSSILDFLEQNLNMLTIGDFKKEIETELEKSKLAGFSVYKRKDGKKSINIKLTIGELREIGIYGDTHYVKLNDYISEKNEISTQTNETSTQTNNLFTNQDNSDDLPF